jgi:hypothetical protein
MQRALAALCLAGCVVSEAPEIEPAMDSDEWTVSATDWTLGWDWGEAESTVDGWTTTTDEGYLVTVDGGWMVDYAVTLSPCEEEVVAQNRWLSLVGIGTAHADHPDFTDPSRIEPVLAESLRAPEPMTLTAGIENEEA